MPTREFSCGSCAFRIRSENEDELVEFVQQHARDTHDVDMSGADIQGGWRTV